jgi:hypothetical protein
VAFGTIVLKAAREFPSVPQILVNGAQAVPAIADSTVLVLPF